MKSTWWKISILSLIVCVLLLVSYFLGGIKPEAVDLFKRVMGYWVFMFLVTTSYMIYELNQREKKVQIKPGE